MSEGAPKRRFGIWRKLAPIGVGIFGAWAIGALFLPQPVELFLQLPPGFAEFSSIDVRVVSLEDGRQVLRTRGQHAAGARTVVLRSKLKAGHYRIEAWPDAPAGVRWEAAFEASGDATDVALR